MVQSKRSQWQTGRSADRIDFSSPDLQTYDALLSVISEYTDLQTFMREQHLKFAAGELSLDKWSAFIDEATKTYNLQKIMDDATVKLKKLRRDQVASGLNSIFK